MALTVLSSSKLLANLLERYLEPLQASDAVSRILVVRQGPISDRLSKVQQVNFRDHGTASNLLAMYRTTSRTLARENVDWVLGFNPVPWGSIGALAAARHRLPVSLSFIGRDIQQIMRPQAKPLWAAVRYAKLITVTGNRMRSALERRGVSADKIRVLPHVVDTDRFAPVDDEPDLDVVVVGQLIERKRIDVVIDAAALLRDRGVRLRVGILGTGPLREQLAQQIRDRRVADRVELLGFRDDVENVLRRARIFTLVSSWEGVPFAMIEAMCCGLVPIVTDVGTITDWITDGGNGRIVPVGDPWALADALEELLTTPDLMNRLRDAALEIRPSVSLATGVGFWEEALGTDR